MNRPLQFARPLLAVLVGLLAASLCGAVGCGGDQKQSDGSERPKLPCEKQGYPCTFGEVDDEVNRRTFELLGGVSLRAREGANWESALEWLRDQSSVAEARGSSDAIRFRLEGGRPAWVYLGLNGDSLSESSDSSGTGGNSTDTITRRSPVVAGDDRDPREPKEGLVLTADWLPAPDVTRGVRDALDGADAYNVTFRTDRTDDITLSDFKNWEQYDFVYFLAHGACDDEECRNVSIGTGSNLDPWDKLELEEYVDARWKDGECDQAENFDLTEQQRSQKEAVMETIADEGMRILQNSDHAGTPGLTVGKNTDCELRYNAANDHRRRVCRPTLTWVLEAPFFRNTSGDLEDTLVVGNGCALFANRASDFAEVFGGDERAFLGWSNIVTGLKGNPVITDLVDLVVERGVPAWTALKTLEGRDGGDRADGRTAPELSEGTKEVYCDLPDLSPAELRHSEQRDTIRVREIVTAKRPSGTVLGDGQSLSTMVNGIPGDGQNDALELHVLVEGIDEAASTASSDPAGYEIRFKWNGEEVGGTYNVDEKGQPSPNTDYAYLVEVDQLSLGTDIDPNQTHSLTTIVELPEGGTSKVEADGLTVDPCWANWSAGDVGWDSEEVGATERFGNVTISRVEGKGGISEVGISPQGKNDWAKASIQESVHEPGAYPASFHIFLFDEAEFASPNDANGDAILGELVIEQVHEISSTNQIFQGHFRGPVTAGPDAPTRTLTGSFSLPGYIIDGTNGLDVTGGVWPDVCKSDAE